MKLLKWRLSKQREQRKSDVMESLHKYFEKIHDKKLGIFLINGEWYHSIYGCDSLQMFLDDLIES